MVKLPPKTLALWRARLSVLFFALLAVFAHFLSLLVPLLILLYFLLFFWYLPALFISFETRFLANCAEISYGVIRSVKKSYFFTAKPAVRSYSSPFARLLGLEAVVLRLGCSFVILPEQELGVWCRYV